MKVLLCGKESSNELIEEIIRSELDLTIEYQFLFARTATDAISQARNNQDISIVLSGYILEDELESLTGIQALSMIKQDYPHMRTVLISMVEPRALNIYLETGAIDDFHHKNPLQTEKLCMFLAKQFEMVG